MSEKERLERLGIWTLAGLTVFLVLGIIGVNVFGSYQGTRAIRHGLAIIVVNMWLPWTLLTITLERPLKKYILHRVDYKLSAKTHMMIFWGLFSIMEGWPTVLFLADRWNLWPIGAWSVMACLLGELLCAFAVDIWSDAHPKQADQTALI